VKKTEQPATSLALNQPARARAEVALEKAVAALAELLAVVDRADELAAEACHAARHHAGIAEARHAGAKLRARQAIQDIDTLREGS
jgi:hypothetical protein